MHTESGNSSFLTSALPIFDTREEIVELIRSSRVLIVAGETGSGKTTRLPEFCLEAGRGINGKIICTQPRRIAAVSLSRYVDQLIDPSLSGGVGFKIRFHDRIPPSSRIAFVTDGILLAEISIDPMLSRYDTIIIDEAHERTLNIDFLLGYLRTLLPRRPDLKIILSSATLDTELFSRAFNGAPVVKVSGRMYPIEIRYKPVIALWDGTSMRSQIDGVITAVREIIDSGDQGDILAFMPTVDDIMETVNGLTGLRKGTDDLVVPLYGRMSPEGQDAVFKRHKGRRIIIATNIAETSITVPGIRFVVDTGLARTVRYDTSAGINRMPVERISRASADQRSGRCGRVEGGICIRLFSETDYGARPRFSTPEIKRSNLSGVILRMARLHLGRPESFPFLQSPSPAALNAGYRQLKDLGALDRKGNITSLGVRMASLPLDPAIARMLLHAHEHGAFKELAVISSALSVGDIRQAYERKVQEKISKAKNSIADPGSDFMLLLRIWRELPRTSDSRSTNDKARQLKDICDRTGLSLQKVREWIDVHRQLVRICRRFRHDRKKTPDIWGKRATYEQIHKSLLVALWTNLAEYQDKGVYRTSRKHDVMVSPGSQLFRKETPWVLFHDIVETSRPYGRMAATIDPRWIQELFPERCRGACDHAAYDPDMGYVRALRRILFNGFVLVKNQGVDYGNFDPQDANAIFIREALVNGQLEDSYAFVNHNNGVRERILAAQRKLRDNSYYAGDHVLEGFYEEHLPGISSIRQLNGILEKAGKSLFIKEEDLLARPLPQELKELRDSIVIGDTSLQVSYIYDPGDESDGITITVPRNVYLSMPLYYWEWLLPALWKDRIRAFLANESADPAFMNTAVSAVLSKLQPQACRFHEAIGALIKQVFPGSGGSYLYNPFQVPKHLWPLIRIIDEKGIIVDAFRPPLSNPVRLSPLQGKRPEFLAHWCAGFEKDCSQWDSTELLESAAFGSPRQLIPVFGYPALTIENKNICSRIFLTRASAFREHGKTLRYLVENELSEEIAWQIHTLKLPERLLFMTRTHFDKGYLESLLHHICHECVLELPYDLPRTLHRFKEHLSVTSGKIPTCGTRSLKLLSECIEEYIRCREILDKMTGRFSDELYRETSASLNHELENYLKVITGEHVEMALANQLPRWLRAFENRIEAGYMKRERYRICMNSIHQFRILLNDFRLNANSVLPGPKEAIDSFALTIEEYAISLFANGRISLLFPVSEQKLEEKAAMVMEMLKHDNCETAFYY